MKVNTAAPISFLRLAGDSGRFEIDADDFGKRLVPNDLIALAGRLSRPGRSMMSILPRL
jgi:hypothetical protein